MATGFRNWFATMPRTGPRPSRRSSHPALRVAGDARAGPWRGCADLAGHHLVNETEPIGFVRLDWSTRQHELHGRAHADQLHGTNRAAETGMNAELDLGQTETHPPVVTGDAIAHASASSSLRPMRSR